MIPIDRELVMQTVVVLGICLGGWMTYVNAKVKELAGLHEEVASKRAVISDEPLKALQRVSTQVAPMLERAREIERRSRLAGDSAMLFARIMELATVSAVEVINLQPRVERQSKDRRRGGKGEVDVGVTRIDITVKGGYESLASFVGSLDAIGTFLRLSQVQVSPVESHGEPLAVMQLTAQALSFQLPRPVEAMRGAAGDDS